MPHKYKLFVLFFFCSVFGWVLGFLQVCYFSIHNLLFGLFICFVAIILTIALYFVVKRSEELDIYRKYEILNTDEKMVNFINSIIIFFFVCIAFWLNIVLSYFNKDGLNNEFSKICENINYLQYKDCLEDQKFKALLLLDLFKNLDSNDLMERDAKIYRIITLSSAEKLSKYWNIYSRDIEIIYLRKKLLMLNIFNLIRDTIQYHKFNENVSFYGVELMNSNLKGMNFSGMDLKYANLQNSNLEGANFNNANLRSANLVGVNLNKASLVGTNLIAARLSKSDINRADLQNAKLDSTDLSNSSVKESNLERASFVNAIICNANFQGSNLKNCLLSATYMANVNFNRSVLANAEIYDTDIGTAILDSAIVNVNWSDQLIKRNTSGVNTMLRKYFIYVDSLSNIDTINYLVKLRIN